MQEQQQVFQQVQYLMLGVAEVVVPLAQLLQEQQVLVEQVVQEELVQEDLQELLTEAVVVEVQVVHLIQEQMVDLV